MVAVALIILVARVAEMAQVVALRGIAAVAVGAVVVAGDVWLGRFQCSRNRALCGEGGGAAGGIVFWTSCRLSRASVPALSQVQTRLAGLNNPELA